MLWPLGITSEGVRGALRVGAASVNDTMLGTSGVLGIDGGATDADGGAVRSGRSHVSSMLPAVTSTRAAANAGYHARRSDRPPCRALKALANCSRARPSAVAPYTA